MGQTAETLSPSQDLSWGLMNKAKISIAFVVAFCTEVSNYLCDVTPYVAEGVYGFLLTHEDLFSPQEIAALPNGWDAIIEKSLTYRLEDVAELTRKDNMDIRVRVHCFDNGIVRIVADVKTDAIKELYI